MKKCLSFSLILFFSLSTSLHPSLCDLTGLGSSPREKYAAVKNSPASRASSDKVLSKSKVPVKRSVLERTPSISSLSSTQSERSLFSSNCK